ncbi:hypothetical protein H257_05820 [Aphanomyces astaci]|uniref:Uncharacterized protein n=1 Tax=Aphanomyces astaci TaxID=112090 RepID=W4GQU0_APHAT|nr:hypothetical protein H257_05820 [Aphanomyces astaci]ETV81258.1 hypothetical protein H257_05820 [Aphanomyces astaci]|eukprot:XP_009829116.1 hypothetical protein H257_05820 [Aphanomyces astaci]
MFPGPRHGQHHAQHPRDLRVQPMAAVRLFQLLMERVEVREATAYDPRRRCDGTCQRHRVHCDRAGEGPIGCGQIRRSDRRRRRRTRQWSTDFVRWRLLCRVADDPVIQSVVYSKQGRVQQVLTRLGVTARAPQACQVEGESRKCVFATSNGGS